MPSFVQNPVAIGQDGFVSSATQVEPLGALGITKDGRQFRYVKAGAADLVAGNVIQGPATVPNHLALTPSAASIGATQIVATLGATLASLNQYAEGYVMVSDGGASIGQGNIYGVSGHAAVLSGGVITANLKADDPVQVALTGSSRVGFIANPFNGVIQAPITTATGLIIGVAPYIISAGQFGWVQCYGVANVLINGTPALGSAVTGVSATTAGAVDVAVAASLIAGQVIGDMLQIGVSTKCNAVFLRM